MQNKNIVILGSTGSIGTQTLDVVRKSEKLNVVGLSAHSNIDLLETQIIEFNPQVVCVIQKDKAYELQNRLKAIKCKTEVVSGEEGLLITATLAQAELIITAVVGMVGLLPTIAAIKQGKNIALANKETLVTAGEIVMQLAEENNISIIPVDSEHSAIFQCLQGNAPSAVSKIILTASGGPFREYSSEQLQQVTVEQALKHPNWVMGNKITIDSATLMNKGLEVIEAKHLFNIMPSQIEVIVHKESIIHSMVEYQDGSTIAQLSYPDMRHPISYAIYYPSRVDTPYIKKLNLSRIQTLSFEEPRMDLFPCLQLAYEALKTGGTMPAVLNAANEVVVESFLNRQVTFMEIPRIIHKVMQKHICINRPTLNDLLECDRWAREYSRKKVEKC
ncbi:1-deoxy-D-xylulose-5-phosphate reductoisomerase [Cellulosilyticum sp. I15G10I2]|uniref:1-deoxy-D-xylulose-5-phosphate reductoisomerase n=1 Tax=Cellulosilyticum sp. I15G10I2 TaxID=1892843 RepID=UPI00085CDC89|nr:1-deoxy-D-xylulose-5-phosphate reductoisomerase [Cellulosilyticum sp. I15G10I2]